MRGTASVFKFVFTISAFLAASVIGCSDDNHSNGCDPAKGDRCSCDIDDATTCPGGFLCRPSGGDNVCEPEGTAGRIPSCLDPSGLDVFAAEADNALSVSWKVNGMIDFSGGFDVLYGTSAATLDQKITVGPDARRATIAPLDNGVSYFISVAPLGANGMGSFVSCQVAGIPHVLAFNPDGVVNAVKNGDQGDPDLASNAMGTALYVAFEDENAIALVTSGNFGDAWSEVKTITMSGQNPAIAVRDAVTDEKGVLLKPELLYSTWEEGGNILFAIFDPELGTFSAPVTIGKGTNPDITLGVDRIHVAFVDGAIIHHAGSKDDGKTFGVPVAVSGSLVNAKAPSIAVHPTSGGVLIAWDAIEGAGDSNAYSATSKDGGESFAMPVRIDDDKMGQNQLNVSAAVDPQTGEFFATWEDRRGGANVFFSTSKDGGASWAPNVDVGAGLGGDQFHPRAVVDVAGNVYVALQDTTNGQRVVFSRFNENGTFDPPLAPSTVAGQGGVVGDHPSVATDLFGTIYVAWEENRNGPDLDVVFARAD